MKKKITTLGIAATLCVTPMNAQPQLRADNIDEILKAMTLAEAGSYQVMIGASIADIRAQAAFTHPRRIPRRPATPCAQNSSLIC